MKKKRRPIQADLDTLIPLLIGQWRRFLDLSGPPDRLQTREFRRMTEAVRFLQQGLYVDHKLKGKDYFSERELLGAYLLYHWIIHYQEALAVIGELPEAPKRVLDVCSGPLPMAFAALHHGASEVIATDRHLDALLLGAQVCGRYGYPVSTRRWDCLQQPLPVEGEFDLIIVGHCLEELFPPEKKGWADAQELWLKQLLKKLSPNGYLLIIEGSYTETNRRVLELRDRLVQDGVPVQAPCVWKGQCPAIKAKYHPCYAQREMEKPYHIKEIQRAAQINLSSLKMSYVIFRNQEMGWPETQGRSLYRVVSPMFETPQGKKIHLCGTNGKKSLESRFKEHPHSSRAFDYLRRGELIELEGSVESGKHLFITEDTSLKVEAALNKPFLTQY